MEAKEKANELVDMFDNVVHSNAGSNNFNFESAAKQCALICVDKILVCLWNVGHSFCNDEIKYYKEVKQEINKL